MPTYDYRCEVCQHEFEVFQRISEERLRECPECKGMVKRLIGAGAGLIFKGSGFYITDYRSKDYQDKAKSEQAQGSKDPASKDSAPKETVAKPKEKSSKETKASAPAA